MIRTPLPAALGLAIAALPAAAAAADVTYSLTNASSLAIMEFYASPADTGAWGEDLLAAEVLEPGATGTLTIVEGTTQCATDLRFVMEDGQEHIERVDVCGTPSFTLSD